MRPPTFYQKCRDQQWHINHLEHQQAQHIEQIRNLKDRLAIETARQSRVDANITYVAHKATNMEEVGGDAFLLRSRFFSLKDEHSNWNYQVNLFAFMCIKALPNQISHWLLQRGMLFTDDNALLLLQVQGYHVLIGVKHN